MKKIVPRSVFHVTRNALVKRINRKLAPDGERLVTPRSERDWQAVGYHTVNDRNCQTASRIDLEEFGRELGALSPLEKLVDDDAAG